MYKVINYYYEGVEPFVTYENVFITKKSAIKEYKKFSKDSELFLLKPLRDNVIKKKLRGKKSTVTRSLQKLAEAHEADPKQIARLQRDVQPNWVRRPGLLDNFESEEV